MLSLVSRHEDMWINGRDSRFIIDLR